MKTLDTNERLLEATLGLVSEKGYLGATTREIAQRAGLSELTLFRHFKSKEGLFGEMLARFSFLPELKGLLPGLSETPCEEALFAVGARFLETLKKRKALVRIILSEINLYPEKIRKVYGGFVEEIIGTLAGYFSGLGKKGALRPVPPRIAARAFLGMFFCYFHAEEIIGGRGISKKELRETTAKFVDIFVRGVMKN